MKIRASRRLRHPDAGNSLSSSHAWNVLVLLLLCPETGYVRRHDSRVKSKSWTVKFRPGVSLFLAGDHRVLELRADAAVLRWRVNAQQTGCSCFFPDFRVGLVIIVPFFDTFLGNRSPELSTLLAKNIHVRIIIHSCADIRQFIRLPVVETRAQLSAANNS